MISQLGYRSEDADDIFALLNDAFVGGYLELLEARPARWCCTVVDEVEERGDKCCFLTKVVLFFNIRILMHINAF